MSLTLHSRGNAAHRNSSKDLLDNVQLGDMMLLTLRLQGVLGFDVPWLDAKEEREHGGETRHACHNVEDHAPTLRGEHPVRAGVDAYLPTQVILAGA